MEERYGEEKAWDGEQNVYREVKQIATTGADTTTGETFPPTWDTAHVRRLHPATARKTDYVSRDVSA